MKALHYHLVLLVVTIIAVAAILVIERAVDVRPWVYFGIDKYEYNPGDYVSIIVSNIGTEPVNLVFGNRYSVQDFPKIRNAITVHREDDPKLEEPLAIPELNNSKDITISPGSKGKWQSSWADQRWQFPTKNEKDIDLPEGLYRVVYNGPIYRPTGIRFKYKLLHPTKGKIEGYDPWEVAQRFVIAPPKHDQTHSKK